MLYLNGPPHPPPLITIINGSWLAGRTVIFFVSLNAWKHEERWHLFSINMNIGHISVSFSYDEKISFRPV